MKKKTMNYLIVLVAMLLGLSPAGAQAPQRQMRLHYDRPAAVWMTEALPIGNGELGAMFFGEVLRERVQFNEKTLWTGSPEIRGAYQSFGDLYLLHRHGTDYTSYSRSLSLDDAIGRVHYTIDGVRYEREYLASHPDGVVAIRIATPGHRGKISMGIRMADSRHASGGTTRADLGMLTFRGKLDLLHYEAQVRVQTLGGNLSTRGRQLQIEGADEVLIYLAAKTNYDIHAPGYTRGDAETIAQDLKQSLDAALAKGYDAIRRDHISDYQRLYGRVKIQLDTKAGSQLPDMTTDRLVRQHRSSTYLDELYFQYGRYLMIASSRGMDLPNNLQGIWNNDNTPPWECDIHTNINIQMNYWPAETTNLSECHLPLLKYLAVESVRPNGGMRRTAQNEGLRGWSVHTQSTIFSHTDWNINRPANAWYSMHLWQYYLYTQDKKYLAEVALPVMQSACEYWFDRLKKNDKGQWVAPAEWSPEHGPWEDGVAYAQQLVWELFHSTRLASKVVKLERKFVNELELKHKDLDRGLHIGSWGQIKEWTKTEDVKGNEHRHLSHLIALYPGNQISYAKDRTLAEAAKTTLRSRGDAGTGWSRAWKIGCWARLGDGDHALRLLKSALNHTTITTVLMEDDSYVGGVYENLFDAHPPFQIDGNFGATAGIAEMLMQSHQGYIYLLPALPKAWHSGAVSGLKAVGAFEVELAWTDARVTKLEIKSLAGQTLRIKLPKGQFFCTDSHGRTVSLRVDRDGIATFSTKAGVVYRITEQ